MDLRRSGDCPTHGNIRARRGEHGRAGPGAEIGASGIGRRRACACQTVSARRIDNLRHSGIRLTDRNIGARAGRGSAVGASRINRRRARARAAMCAGRINTFRRSGFRARDRKIRSRNGRPRHPGRRTAVRASRIDRRRARAGAAICAGRVDSFRREGGRLRARNIRARRQRRCGCPFSAVSAGRIGGRRARAPRNVSARRVYEIGSAASLAVVSERCAVTIERHNTIPLVKAHESRSVVQQFTERM